MPPMERVAKNMLLCLDQVNPIFKRHDRFSTAAVSYTNPVSQLDAFALVDGHDQRLLQLLLHLPLFLLAPNQHHLLGTELQHGIPRSHTKQVVNAVG